MRLSNAVYIVLLQFCLHQTNGYFKQSDNDFDDITNNIDQTPTEFNPNGLSPIIFIPGLGGNRLQAKLNKPSVPNFWCSRKRDFFNIWLDPFALLPYAMDCWVDNMKLIYDQKTRKMTSPIGVEIRVPEWGRTETMEKIDTIPFVDLFDFDQNVEWFERLAYLTEYIYSINGVAVTFITHSMGSRMLLYFLQEMPLEWKKQYVKRVISLSSPWGGSTNTIKAFSTGYNFGIDLINSQKMKQIQETYPSLVWLLPSPYFWKENEILVTANGRNYTLQNIDQFFYDIGSPHLVEIRKDLQAYNSFMAPAVEMHCLFSSNGDGAIEKFHFGESFNAIPKEIKGNGDGTVNRRSLVGCEYWKNTPAQLNYSIYQQEFKKIDHYNILSDSRTIDYIIKTLFGYARAKRHSTNAQPTHHKIMRIRLF